MAANKKKKKMFMLFFENIWIWFLIIFYKNFFQCSQFIDILKKYYKKKLKKYYKKNNLTKPTVVILNDNKVFDKAWWLITF